MITVFRPADGQVIAEVPEMSGADLDVMYASAREAQRTWNCTSALDRAKVLFAAADLMHKRAEEFASVDGENTGRLPSASFAEVNRCVDALRYYAGWVDKAYGATIPVDHQSHVFTEREPYGVVLAITPWNVGLRLSVKKAAQALAFGNSVILKPAPETPLSTMMLEGVFREAGLPEGALQVAVGGGELGAAAVDHPGTDLITFTGSTSVGRRIAKVAGYNLRPVITELGGKSPQVIFGDADLDRAVEAVTRGGFRHAGQMCVAGSRVFVDESIYSDVLERLSENTRTQVVGHPKDSRTTVGPQISASQRDKTLSIIDKARADGLTIAAQAGLPASLDLAGGFYTPPTVFRDVDHEAPLMEEEVFGPVLAVGTFTDEADAIAKANASQYGLAAGIWSRDGARALRVSRESTSGVVWINNYLTLGDAIPFGGNGDSGIFRENGDEAYRSFTRLKSVVYSMA